MRTAYNGVTIPAFMYGTAWKKEATTRLVLDAVNAGFTAIDTANQLIHYDEARVGKALLRLSEQGVTRERLFLQTKFTPVDGQDHRTPYDPAASITIQVQQSFDSSLAHLHTDYVDSYVLHGPYHRGGLGPEDWEVWAAIESLYASGRTKLIGVSNVSAGQLALFCERATHRPMVVQNRCYAAFGWDKAVRDLCRTHGIVYQGFSLLTANRAELERVHGAAYLDALEHAFGAGLRERDGLDRGALERRLAIQPQLQPAVRPLVHERHAREDRVALVGRLVAELHRDVPGSPASCSPEAIEQLAPALWPGNVRELRNVIERATILAAGPFIEPRHLPPGLAEEPPVHHQPQVALAPGTTVEEAERRLIMMTLEHTRDNKTRAAEILGISLKTLHNKLNKLRGRVPGKKTTEEEIVPQ